MVAKSLAQVGAVVLALGGFASGLSGQKVHQEPPPVGEIVVGVVTGGTGGTPGAPSQIQIVFSSGSPTITLNVGASRAQVLQALGNPMIVSLLQRAGLIAFDPQGGLIPGPNAQQGGARPEPVASPPSGPGGSGR